MSERITFVSSADHNYYAMLREWVHCIRSFPQSKDMDICIFDVGMTQEQVENLRPHVTKIIKPDWPASISASRIKGREYYKACVNRPFINEHFPGYDLYFWMDADTWVQDWRAVELFLEGARRGKMALTSQADRAYPKGMRVKWLGPWPWKPRSFYFSNALKAFGIKTAQKIFPYHVVLAGAFALRADAPHWKKWQELIVKALDNGGKVFTAEQLTLGIMTHLEEYPVEILPAYLHWLCEFKPLWDKEKQMFVEPYLPHEPIGILHLSGFDKMRIDRSDMTDFKTTDGDTIEYTYRYPFFNGETGQIIDERPKTPGSP